jgi:uncharacterized phage protein gp47/JayE
MALTIPSTTTQTSDNVAYFEAKIFQSVPALDVAFVRVISAIMATMSTGHYKYLTNLAKQNLALTADFDALINLGNEYGVEYKQAVAANLTFEFSASGGTSILESNFFIGDSNGVRYNNDATANEVGGVITVTATAETTGVIGNLEVSVPPETVQIGTGVSGVSRQGNVTAVNTTGAEAENIEVYRQRVLQEIRTVGGGGNSADYRRSAESVEGVLRAYPYSGNPTGPETSLPGERTVYVEAQTSIDPDGIPTQALLDQVRDAITTDEDTGLANQPLGMTDETLYVEAITRTTFDVTINGLVIDAQKETAAKADIETDLGVYFRSVIPFVDGLDVPADRNDTITTGTVWQVVQGVLTKYGATAQSLEVEQGGNTVLEYLLDQGEMAKLGTVSY